MTLSRSFAAGAAVGLLATLVFVLPTAASASVWDYNGPSILEGEFCVDYGYGNFGGCSGGSYPQIQQNYGGGYGYYQQPSYQYYPQQQYYQQPSYQYYPQQYSYYNNNHPQVNYQPVSYSYVVPMVTINSGYYGGGYGYGGGYWY